MADACRISPSTRKTLEREFTGLHEGLRPSSISCTRWSNPENPRAIAVATEIQYAKRIPGETPDFHHPWKFQAQPTIGLDSGGRLLFKSGRYEVRRRGIEDRVGSDKPGSPYLVHRHVKSEHWVTRKPGRLVALGKLRWLKIRYMGLSGPGAEETLRFPSGSAPTLAHDQDGNLHVLGGRYRIRHTGVAHMARRRRRHSRHARRNPSFSVMSRRSKSRGSRQFISASKHAGALAALALVGTATAIGLDAGLGATSLSPTAKAFVKGGVATVGLIGGSIASMMGAPVVGAGIIGAGLGSAIDAMLDGYNLWVAPTVARMTTPAAGAMLPAGAPDNFRSYAPQSCAVAR